MFLSWKALIDIEYDSFIYAEEKRSLFLPSGQVRLGTSYITVFFASVKGNNVCLVISPVLFFFSKGIFWNTAFY